MLIVCALLAMMSLPVTALFLDTVLHSWALLAVALIGSMAIGAAVGAVLSDAAGSGAGARRGAILGGVLGTFAALIGAVGWFLLMT
jgi:hypothetical protein